MLSYTSSDHEHVPQARAQESHHASGDCSTSRGPSIDESARLGVQPPGADGSRLVRLWQRPREAAVVPSQAAASAYGPSAIGSGPNPSATATETNVAVAGNQQSTQPQASKHQAAGQYSWVHVAASLCIMQLHQCFTSTYAVNRNLVLNMAPFFCRALKCVSEGGAHAYQLRWLQA
jgi:hypothetical protein